MSISSLKELQTIPGVGKSIAQDLVRIGIHSVADLKGKDPQDLYDASNRRVGRVQDRCLLYVFRCAVYFAERKKHDPEKLKWWNWKDVRASSWKDPVWFVYMLECRDGSLYTGISNRLEERLRRHQAGKGAAYTRSRLPVRFVWQEKQSTESAARKREARIKRLSRTEKRDLMNGRPLGIKNDAA